MAKAKKARNGISKEHQTADLLLHANYAAQALIDLWYMAKKAKKGNYICIPREELVNITASALDSAKCVSSYLQRVRQKELKAA